MFKRPVKVKVAIMVKPGLMEIHTYPNPKINNDTAIIRVEMCGICGTDKHVF